MASLIYNSVLNDIARSNVDFDTDTFKTMLTTSAYTENKDTHAKRSDVTSEVVGTGYTAGGTTVAVTVAAIDTANDRQVITFASINWPTSTITARKAVTYKSRGGAASADELVFVNDFGADVISTSGTFTIPACTITFQN